MNHQLETQCAKHAADAARIKCIIISYYLAAPVTGKSQNLMNGSSLLPTSIRMRTVTSLESSPHCTCTAYLYVVPGVQNITSNSSRISALRDEDGKRDTAKGKGIVVRQHWVIQYDINESHVHTQDDYVEYNMSPGTNPMVSLASRVEDTITIVCLR